MPVDPPRTGTISVEDFGICPECGAPIAVSSGLLPGSEPAVAHGFPMCATFTRLDTVSYGKWVNTVRASPLRVKVPDS